MGIKETYRKIVGEKKKERWSCKEEQPGVITCKSWREHAEGNEELARFDVAIDGQCKGYPQNMEEFEPGSLEKLEKSAWHKIQQKCQSAKKPEDY